MAAPRIDIGIDGGGTGCRVAVSVAGGAPTEARGGPSNIVTDPAGAEAAIREALLQAMAPHGLGLEDMDRARVCAGLAGGRLPGVADAFAMRLPFLAYVVDDSVTALEGALGPRDGTLASLGTGSFFVRREGASLRHVGGWGFVLGDEGSAAWLGRRALSRALKVGDGRLPSDPLADALVDAVPDHPVIFARDANPSDFAKLARLVLKHAGTPMARALVAETMAALAAGLEDVGHEAGSPLVLTGGLGEMLSAQPGFAFAADLEAPAGRPLDGALAMARRLP